MMDNKTHKLSGRFCPFCLMALWQVRETGFEFCPGNPACDYEVRPGADQTAPLTKWEKVEQVLKNKQHEHSLLLKKAGELQGKIAELTRELTDMGFPPPDLSFDHIVRLKAALTWLGHSTPESMEECAAKQKSLVLALIRTVERLKKEWNGKSEK